MTDANKEKLKKRLSEYPGATEESIEKLSEALEERAEFKANIMKERGFSNKMAEKYLDIQGYPRPPGWNSVLLYPGSMSPRPGTYLVVGVIIIGFFFFG